MTFQFKSNDNKMSSPAWHLVMAPKHVEKSIQFLLSHYNVATIEELKDHSKDTCLMVEALECVKKLPQRSFREGPIVNWDYFHKAKGKWDDVVHMIGIAENFNAELKLDKIKDITESEFKKTWEDFAVISSGLKKISSKHPNCGAWVDVAVKNLERVAKLKKRIDKNEVVVESIDDPLTHNFVNSHGVALFASRQKSRYYEMEEGFLGADDELVPLVRARLFDSEQAAQTFLNRKNIKNYFDSFQVVKINIETEGLGKLIEGGKNIASSPKDASESTSMLHELVAKIQKDQIEKALKGASRERLIAQLQELDLQDNANQTAHKRKM